MRGSLRLRLMDLVNQVLIFLSSFYFIYNTHKHNLENILTLQETHEVFLELLTCRYCAKVLMVMMTVSIFQFSLRIYLYAISLARQTIQLSA